MAQKRNFGVGKTQSLIKMRQDKFILIKTTLIKVSYYLDRVLVTQFNFQKIVARVNFQLRVFEYDAKWKTRSWKTLKFDQSALEKTPRFSSPSFRFWVQCKMENSERETSEN